MENHIPVPHRKFVQDVRKNTKILDFVNSSPSVTLKAAYQNCKQALVEVRSYHIQFVTKYIIIPHRKRQKEGLPVGIGGSTFIQLLGKFGINVSLTIPETLPEYFEVWNHFSSFSVLSRLVENHELRQELDKMPILDQTRLEGYRQFRLAHLQLSLLVTGYVWQDGEDKPAEKIPRCLAVPYWEVSKVLEMRPALSHCDMVLTNWRFIDEEKELLPNLDNIRMIYKLPGGEEGNWFFKTAVGVELQFCSALEPLVSGLEAAENCDDVTLERCLNAIAMTLRQMKKVLTMTHDGLTPNTFYYTTRPFITGWGGKGSPLPDGLVYEGIDDKPIKFDGGSGGQSSTLQSIDAALGVEHVPDTKLFFTKMENSVPAPHRRFVHDVRQRTKIPAFVNSSPSVTLKTAYQNCKQALADIRTYHIQLVAKYIIIPHHRNLKEEAEDKRGEPIATGGSSIMPLLKSARDASKENNPLL